MAQPVLMAIGCYTEPMGHVKGTPGQGILIAALDPETGALSAVHTVTGPRNPSYLCLSPRGDRLYAVEELGDDAAPHLHTYVLDASTGELTLLGTVPSPGAAACHVQTDHEGRFVFVSNFVSGDLVCYRLDNDGLPRLPAQVITRPGNGTARVHYAAMSPARDRLLVCDAGNDIVAAYRLGADGLVPEPATEIALPRGSFPRHLAAVGDHLIVANEHAATLGLITLGDAPAVSTLVSSLPADWQGAKSGAAVRVHPAGRYGYMSNRGHDSIFVAGIDTVAGTLAPVGTFPSGGRTPRDFAIDPSGRWLVAAHQDSNDIHVHAVDPATGALTATGHTLSTGSPVSVLFLGA